MYRCTAVASALLATALSTTALASADAASRHPSSERAGSFRVTATVKNDEPVVGDKVKIKGSVKPAAPGQPVTLQLRYADQKSWKTVGHATLSQASTFRFKDKVETVRERKYRVVKPAAANRATAHSRAVKVTVFGWRNLDSLNPAQAAGFFEAGNVVINGVTYPNSLESFSSMPPPYHIDYNLNRDCKSLEGRFGLSDRSSAGGTATISLAADGATHFTGSFALTQSQAVSTDVTGVFRITVNATTADGGLAAVASPRVLCSF